LVGGFYIDFGLAGVAFGMFFVGALLQWLYRVTETRRDPFWVGLYGLVLGYCLLSLYSFISLKPVEIFGWLALAWALMPTRGISTLRAARE
jgi:oligosaccharide repeat unit polymerase